MSRAILSACAIFLFLCSTTLAQHANFVLFGSGKQEVQQTPEQKFVHPVTSPYYHEDSFVTSDVRAWAIYHDFNNSGVLNGGSAKVYAVQARLAITDQLQLVAYKDGYTDMDSGAVKDSGWNDVAAGLKYNFIQDWKNQFHMAAGIGYEFPIGDPGIFQNDDEWRFWLSVNKGFDKLHLGGTVNYLYGDSKSGLSEGGTGDSDRLIWNVHVDYFVCKEFSPVIEVNGYHTLNGGNGALPMSLLDVGNVGVKGGDVITAGFGGEVRPIENLGLRAAYELPLTNDASDLFGWRLTFSAVYSF